MLPLANRAPNCQTFGLHTHRVRCVHEEKGKRHPVRDAASSYRLSETGWSWGLRPRNGSPGFSRFRPHTG